MVETDHQPLKIIVKKTLNTAPKRLQRMLLQLQMYSLTVWYQKGKHMYLADNTLSRAFLPTTDCSAAALDMASIDHTTALALPAEKLQQFQHASADHPAPEELRKAIQMGWQANEGKVAEVLQPYYDFRISRTFGQEICLKFSTCDLYSGHAQKGALL